MAGARAAASGSIRELPAPALERIVAGGGGDLDAPVGVEAGLGLDAALSRVADSVEGPFAVEMNITMREISLGKLRREALREMADRVQLADLTTFITAVVQAESMGTSIATVLRVQAEQMRIKRRQRAEQQAQQATRVPPDVLAAPFAVQTTNTVPAEPTPIGFFTPAVVVLLLQHIAVSLASL